MINLKRENFAAIARKGSYVYCYLRHSDSKTARAGTPYYIGLSSVARRPASNHGEVPVPADRSLIRVLRSGLDLKEAEKWEIFFISWYGRKIDGGILLNIQTGGEGGGCGAVWSEEQKKAASIARKGVSTGPFTSARKENIRQAALGRKASLKTRAKLSASHIGLKRSSASVAATALGRNINTAQRYGLDLHRYLAASAEMRVLVVKRVVKGIQGDDIWLPMNIQPRTARMCRTKGICIEAYSKAGREIQKWVREQIRCGKPVPAGFAAA